ncbi:F-box/lrr-repeat protein 18 [Plakobranchus ocellatus]|uniref:F-box/lrr-repeat protein 18 n=1 Tax=Plakobranchus ocellatus TaxID=259542 RepID=A0AAV4A470_9GAST|nr:F-box/lrr-repeat protein 18 [Plakobranchus ocellatus]
MASSEDEDSSKKLVFDRLSDEIILFIFQKLEFQDIFHVAQVCKRFSQICKDKSLTRHITVAKNYWLTSEKFKDFLRPIADSVEALNLNSCYWLRPAGLDVISKCINLTSLHLIQVRLSVKNLCSIMSFLSNLTNLSFSISDIRDLHPELAASTGAQECLARLVKLSLHFRHQLVYSNCPVINFCSGPTLFEYCRKLEEFYVYGFPSNARGIPKYIFQPQILKPENLKNVRVMALNDALDPAARMFFFGTLLAVCKLSVKFQTLLQPSGNVDQLWTMDGYATCLQNMEELVHFDPSRTTFQIPSEVLHFETAHNLQYLNLSDNAAVTAETLHLLADTCPKLTSLNLQNCNYILLGPLKEQNNSEQRRIYNDISGLQALLLSCVELRSLNISGIHVHTQDLAATPYSSLAALLALNTKWTCLSISPCCLSVERNAKSNKRTFSLVPEGYLVKRRRIGANAANQSFSMFSDASSPTRSQDDPSTSSSPPSSFSPSALSDEPSFVPELEKLVRSCPHIQNFELNCSGFRSAFNKYFGVNPTTCTSSPCMFSLTVGDQELMCIGRWKYLKSLQLTSIPGVNQGHCLVAIAKGCVSLEQLSIASLGQIAHCLYRGGLVAAFPFFSVLKDFRLEHPYLKVDEMMLSAMAKCSTLERVCIIAKSGTMDTEGVKELFEKTQKKLEATEMWFLRRMLRISWTAKKTNDTVLEEAHTTRLLISKIRKRQATFFGHVMRREKLENLVTTGMLEGKRSRGKQREKLIEGLTDWLKAGKSLEAIEATKDRKKWRTMIANAVECLISFQLYTGRSLTVCRGLQAYLMSKYKKSRPAVSVCIHPLLAGGLQEATAQMPDQHIDEMTILKSTVAMRPYEWNH